MRQPPRRARLDDGRLHLQDGPIDLIIQCFGADAAVARAEAAAWARFETVLDELCAELPLLRAAAAPDAPPPAGPVARRMAAAVAPFAGVVFVTPMAAVAGAVADAILAAMTQVAPLRRASVNNGGDIALHLAPGERFTIAMIDRPDRPSAFGRATIDAESAVRGIATSGWRGRSFSLGIADAVTVLAADAAAADAAATLIANAVDLPDHPAIRRAPACDFDPQSDLGDRRVTRAVGALDAAAIEAALDAGRREAERLRRAGLIVAAALHLQGETRLSPSPACAGKREAFAAGGPGRRSPADLPDSAPYTAPSGSAVAPSPTLPRFAGEGEGAACGLPPSPVYGGGQGRGSPADLPDSAPYTAPWGSAVAPSPTLPRFAGEGGATAPGSAGPSLHITLAEDQKFCYSEDSSLGQRSPR